MYVCLDVNEKLPSVLIEIPPNSHKTSMVHWTGKLLYSTEIGAELAEKSKQMCSIAIKMTLKTVEMRQDFPY